MQPNTPTTADVTILVAGLKCGSCVRQVRKALDEQPGVITANVNLATRKATVSFDPDATKVETLIEAIRNRGYGAEMPVTGTSLVAKQPEQSRIQQSGTEA